MQVRCRGRVYPSAAALAARYGVTPSAVYRALRKTGTADRIGRTKLGLRRCASKRGAPVAIGPLAWPSISAAARDLGMERSRFDKLWRRQSPLILAAAMRAVAAAEKGRAKHA